MTSRRVKEVVHKSTNISPIGLGEMLFYARVSALSDGEFNELVLESIKLNKAVRDAVRWRLRRECRSGIQNLGYVETVQNLLVSDFESSKFRRHTNSLLGFLLPIVGKAQRKLILRHWINRGTKDTDNRWLTVADSDVSLVSLNDLLTHWRTK